MREEAQMRELTQQSEITSGAGMKHEFRVCDKETEKNKETGRQPGAAGPTMEAGCMLVTVPGA